MKTLWKFITAFIRRLFRKPVVHKPTIRERMEETKTFKEGKLTKPPRL